MRRFAAVLLLIICLTFPALGGHTVAGGNWCQCGSPGCICDPGETPQGTTHNETDETQDTTPIEELSLCLVAVLLFLRIRA